MDLFVQERNSALLSLDKKTIDEYCNKYGINLTSNEDAYWLGVHQAITGCTDIARDKRLQSVKYILERNNKHFMDDITPDEIVSISVEE